MKPQVAFVFLAFMDVVDQILWPTTCNVNICGPLSVPVQTVPRVPFPHPWLRESALLILIAPTCLYKHICIYQGCGKRARDIGGIPRVW